MSSSQPKKPSWGLKTLVETNYTLKDLTAACNNHNISLKVQFNKNALSVDMMKVMIMVYYDWKIPPQFFTPLKECLTHDHFFNRFPNEENAWIHELSGRSEDLAKWLGTRMKKYNHSNKKEEQQKFYVMVKVAFMCGILFTSISRTQYEFISIKVNEIQRVTLLKEYFKHDCKLTLTQLVKMISYINKDGSIASSHPADRLLQQISTLTNIPNQKKPNLTGNNNNTNISGNEEEHNGSFSFGEDDWFGNSDNEKNKKNIAPTKENIEKLKHETYKKLDEDMTTFRNDFQLMLNNKTEEQERGMNEIKALISSLSDAVHLKTNKKEIEEKRSEDEDNNMIKSE